MSDSMARARLAAGIFDAILIAVAAVLFLGIYTLESDHFVALLWIGSLALVFSILAYLFQAFTTDPAVARAAAWGFMAMGFTVLLGALLFPPANAVSAVAQLAGLILVLLLLAAWVAVIAWRARGRARAPVREAKREAWRGSSPPSAFDYSTAQIPGAAAPPSNAPSGPASPPEGAR